MWCKICLSTAVMGLTGAQPLSWTGFSLLSEDCSGCFAALVFHNPFKNAALGSLTSNWKHSRESRSFFPHLFYGNELFPSFPWLLTQPVTATCKPLHRERGRRERTGMEEREGEKRGGGGNRSQKSGHLWADMLRRGEGGVGGKVCMTDAGTGV